MAARKQYTILAGVATLLAVLLAGFAFELSDRHSRLSRSLVDGFRDRAGLTSALTRSLFSASTSSSQATLAHTYGGKLSGATLASLAAKQKLSYLLVLDGSGRVIAASQTPSPTLLAAIEPGVRLLQQARAPFYISGLAQPTPGGRPTTAFFEPILTASGERIVVSGFDPALIDKFISGYLGTAPQIARARAFVLDSSGAVISSSTSRHIAPGGRLAELDGAATVRSGSGDLPQGLYFVSSPVADTAWHVELVAPKSELFSSINGVSAWLPWAVLAAFAAMAVAALVLLKRALDGATKLHDANVELEDVNRRLTGANAALERRAQDLAHSNAELEQFASIASHDLQEPLRKVRTFAAQLERTEHDRLSEQGQDYLHRMSGAAERMQTLIADLLRFARVSTHGRDFEAVDLGEIVSEALSDLEVPIAESGAKVSVDPLPTIVGDPLQLGQLFSNLLSNALKFRRPGVTPEIRVTSSVVHDEVEIAVSDNGIGFAPRYSGRIFRVFERLHNRTDYPGTGIGLALCRKIVARHGGTITATGVPDEGATFVVRLPLAATEPLIAPVAPATEEPQPASNGSEDAHLVRA